MGLYDNEIRKSLNNIVIVEQSSIEDMLSNIVNVYTEMKAMLIFEIPAQDLLKKLLDIKFADTPEKQKDLFSLGIRLIIS